MKLPLLNDNLSGFSNACGVILGPLEELLWPILEKYLAGYGLVEMVRKKIFNDSLSAGKKLMDGHDCLYISGFTSLLS